MQMYYVYAYTVILHAYKLHTYILHTHIYLYNMQPTCHFLLRTGHLILQCETLEIVFFCDDISDSHCAIHYHMLCAYSLL